MTTIGRVLRALVLITLAAAASVIFVPSVGEFYRCEYRSSNPELLGGSDLATYYLGSSVYFDHHLDPYSDANWKTLWRRGAFTLSHPNPTMQYLPVVNVHEGTGYVASPFNLMVFWTVSRLPLLLVYHLWQWVALLTLTLMTALWSWKLSGKWEATVGAVLLFVFSFSPTLSSAIWWGQIECIYVPLILGTLYLCAFHADKVWVPQVAGVGLAFASAIKIYPAVVVLAMLVIGVCVRNKTITRSALWAIAVGTGLAITTLVVCGWEIVISWRHKMATVYEHYQNTALPYGGKQLHVPTLQQYVLFLHEHRPLGLHLVGAAILWFGTIGSATLYCRRPNWLLSVALVISLLPTIMPHWWYYYSVVMILPFLVVWFTEGQSVWIRGLLVVSYLSINYDWWDAFEHFCHIPPNEVFTLRCFVQGYPGYLLLTFAAILTIRRSTGGVICHRKLFNQAIR